MHIITKTHAAVQNVGLGAQTADHWVRRNGHCSATWLVIEELTQLDTPLWADIACLSMNKKIRFLLLGDFRQLPAVLDGFAGAEVCRELKDSQLVPRALGALALRRVDLRVPDLAARRRARTGAAAGSGAGGPAALPELPCEAAADQRAGEPTARARRCPGGAVRGSRCGADECAADHAGLAGAGGFGSTTWRARTSHSSTCPWAAPGPPIQSF